jgi:hypothetical protein
MYIDKSLLTYDFFLQLREMAIEHPGKRANEWFILSYQSFLNYPLNNSEDLIRLIAFAYSWMPTMIKFKSVFDNNIEDVIQAINLFRNIKDVESFEMLESTIKDVLTKMTKLINNSIVGTSKVLHFNNPQLFPIIDRRVINGWNKFMFVTNQEKKASISNDILISPNRAIPLYILYTKNILYWLKEIRIHEVDTSVRDLEICLYSIGE